MNYKWRLSRATVLVCVTVFAMSVGCASTSTTTPRHVSDDPMKAAAARCPANTKLSCSRVGAEPLKCGCVDEHTFEKIFDSF